jgi:hypothetical protein
VTVLLLAIVTGLVCGGVATQYLKHVYGYAGQFGFVRLLDLDGENNLPSWYSSVALLLSSANLAIIGLHHRSAKKPYAWHWLALALIFLGLSLDEAASLHEMADAAINRGLIIIGYRDSGLVALATPAWLLAGVLFVVIAFLVFWPFLQHLPGSTKALFVIAGGLYIGGAIGVEEVAAIHLTLGGSPFVYSMMVAVEEGLEMVGVVVFLHALMLYMAAQAISFQVVWTVAFPASTPHLPDEHDA